MNHKILFEEKQYLGHNRLSIVIRTILAFFCFMAYYASQNPDESGFSFKKIHLYPVGEVNSGLIFFFIGITIIILSAGLTFILHSQTTVHPGYIVIDGFWTSRRVKIELSSITSVRKSRYKKNIFKRAVYNLHNNGIIKFYTSGEDFIELADNTGFVYRIGSQKPMELYKVLYGQIKLRK